MTEPRAPEDQAVQEESLSREEIVLAQAEIKELLTSAFKGTPLGELYTEPRPQDSIAQTQHRGLRKDYIGTRIDSGDGIYASRERRLEVYSKPRKIRRGVKMGEMINQTEPSSGSQIEPTIEHFYVEIGKSGVIHKASGQPNTPTVVNNALALAREVSGGL